MHRIRWRMPLTLLGWVCVACVGLQAQTIRLAGRVVSADEREPLADARVQLLALPDSLPTGGGITDERGRFGPLRCDSLRVALRASAFGFEPRWINLTFNVPPGDTLIDVGDLVLQPRLMPAIEIEQRRIQTNLAGDTVTFMAQAFGAHEDANVQDLLARMPGLELRGDDLYYNGVKIGRIRLDGKTYEGREALQALAYLPARVVERVVVQHDKHAAQKEAGSLDPILELNIIRKAEYQTGWNGDLTAGVGTNNRYRLGGQLERSTPRRRLTFQADAHNINQTPEQARQSEWVGEGINAPVAGRVAWNDSLGRKTALTLTARLSRTEREVRRTSNLLLFQPDGTAQSRNLLTDAPKTEFRIFSYLELETRFDSLRKLEISGGLRAEDGDDRNQTLALTRAAEGAVLSRSDRLNTNRDLKTESWLNLEYVHRWPASKRRLEVYSYGTLDANRQYHSLASTNAFGSDSLVRDENQVLRDTTRSASLYLYNRVLWVEPVGKKGEAEVAYALAPRDQWNRNGTWDESQPVQRFDSLRSNDYRFVQLAHSALAGYTRQFKWGSLALQLQYSWVAWQMRQQVPVPLTQSRDWQTPRPQLTWNYKLKPQGFIRLSYSTSFQQPETNALAAQIDYRDPLMLRQGNPGLRPFFVHTLWIQSNWTNPTTERNFNLWCWMSLTPRAVVNHLFTQGLFVVGDSVIVLEPGQQLIRSAQEPWELTSWQNASYGLRVNALKSNFVISLGNQIMRQVNRIDGRQNATLRVQPSPGVRWTSQFGKQLSASLSYGMTLIYVEQTGLGRPPDLNYIHRLSPAVDWSFWPTWRLSSDLSFQHNTALAAGLTPTLLLWNISLTHKFLREFRAEAGIYCFDVLAQNTPASREVTANYLRDQEVLALSRYAMLFFRYRLGADLSKK